MSRLLLFLSFVLVATSRAQNIPYTTVNTLQRAADSFAKIDGLQCELKMVHKRLGDTREFKVFLESPSGKTEVKIAADGTFHLPLIPKGDWDRAKVVHTLEKGALTISLYWGFNAAALTP